MFAAPMRLLMIFCINHRFASGLEIAVYSHNMKLPPELQKAQSQLYTPHAMQITDFVQQAESAEYGACTFRLNGRPVIHRVSKITPAKTGQFVTIWKRNEAGDTCPFDATDDFDYVIITATSGAEFGQFIFPKNVLIEKGIVTANGREGKRGIRVYPPWDAANSKQAVLTQQWQTLYFVAHAKMANISVLFPVV